MTIQELIDLGLQVQRWHARIAKGALNVPHPETKAFVDAVLELLGPDDSCGWTPVGVVGESIVTSDQWPTSGVMDPDAARELMRILGRAADKAELAKGATR